MPIWKRVPGFPDYEVSDEGQVRRGEHVMSQHWRGKFIIVSLRRPSGRTSRRVHRLVAEAFIGPRPPGMHTRHLDDDHANNHLVNIAYGTPSENQYDAVHNSVHHNAAKTYCKHNHPLSGDNVRLMPDGGRRCRTCQRRWDRERDQKRRDSRSRD